MATEARPLSLEERRRRRDEKRARANGGSSHEQDLPLLEAGDVSLLPKPSLHFDRAWVQLLLAAIVGVGILFYVWRLAPPLLILASGIWTGLLLGAAATQAATAPGRTGVIWLAAWLFLAIPFIAVPIQRWVLPTRQWMTWGLTALGTAAMLMAVVRAWTIWSAARRARAQARDELAGDREEEFEFPGIKREWPALLALTCLGASVTWVAWSRHSSLPAMATGFGAGLVLGLILGHSAMIEGRSRIRFLLSSLFAAVPLIALPVTALVWPTRAWIGFALPLVAAGLIGATLRLGFHALRWSLPTLLPSREAMATYASSSGLAGVNWMHDTLLKWAGGFILVALGCSAIVLGHERGQEQPVWIGILLIALMGSVGIWTPGLSKRSQRSKSLRVTGQIAFWLSLLAVPFIEVTPNGQLPFVAHPTVRFIPMGLGLVLFGAAWFLQKTSILSRDGDEEAKHWLESPLALLIVIAGLATTLIGYELRQRDVLRIDQDSISTTNLVGTARFAPVDDIESLTIEQPIDKLPLYVDNVQFKDGTTWRIGAPDCPGCVPSSQVYPGQQGIVDAMRAAASLNTQTFPSPKLEKWSR